MITIHQCRKSNFSFAARILHIFLPPHVGCQIDRLSHFTPWAQRVAEHDSRTVSTEARGQYSKSRALVNVRRNKATMGEVRIQTPVFWGSQKYKLSLSRTRIVTSRNFSKRASQYSSHLHCCSSHYLILKNTIRWNSSSRLQYSPHLRFWLHYNHQWVGFLRNYLPTTRLTPIEGGRSWYLR